MNRPPPKDLDSATLRLRQGNDELAAKQARETTIRGLRSARRMSSASIERMDGMFGKAEFRRAIDGALPKLAEKVPDEDFRIELELLLSAIREFLQ